MNCGQCAQWNLRGSPLRRYGYGLCKVDPDPAMRAAKTSSGASACHTGRFEQAGAVTMARREQEKARAR
jgi:hypothetical protein